MDRYSRPDVIIDGEHLTFRASSIGGCPKSLAYNGLAATNEIVTEPRPPGPWLRNAWEESSALEQQAFDLWFDEWTKDGAQIVVLDEPLECELRLNPRKLITGTVDFRVEINGQPTTVEIKVVGKSLFEELDKTAETPWIELAENSLIRKYKTQCGVYAHAYIEPVVLAVCEKADGALTGQVNAYHYPVGSEPIAGLGNLHVITSDVNGAINDLREGVYGCPNSNTSCPWSDACHQVEQTDDEVDRLVSELQILQTESKNIDERIQSIKADLSSIAQIAGGKAVTPNGHKLTWVTQNVQERVVKAHERNFLKVTYNKKKEKPQ